VLSACKKVTLCPHCGAANGIVKKSGVMKISHEPFRANKMADAKKEWMEGFQTVIGEQQGISAHLGKAVEDLNPLKVLELFKRVSAEVSHPAMTMRVYTEFKDAELLALHPEIGRPEDYIWQYISVPPPAIRPSVASEAGNNEDDLTAKLAEITSQNRLLSAMMDAGYGLENTMSNWEVLQQSVALYINSQAPGMAAVGGKPIRGLVQRLKGKQGRFRGNLSGKRVDFSGRTVIGPDPNLRIDEVSFEVLCFKANALQLTL
jgi:DNA-directed RNA polymerase III subunit RPC1